MPEYSIDGITASKSFWQWLIDHGDKTVSYRYEADGETHIGEWEINHEWVEHAKKVIDGE